MKAHAGTCHEDHTRSGRVLRGMIPALVILVLVVISAGCSGTGHYPAGEPESRATGAPSSGYLLQNTVLNGSALTASANPPAGPAPENRTAAAITEAIDSQDPVIRDAAVSLIMPAHGGTFRTSQICDLYDAVNSRWTYVDDPEGGDYYSPASRTIALGFKGDCDDFAIVIAAMIESVGGNARVVYAKNRTAGHAYPEVFIGTTQDEFGAAAAYIRQRYHVTDVGCHITRSETGTYYWLNLDWWNRHPGGKFFADDGVRTVYYPDGRWERVVS